MPGLCLHRELAFRLRDHGTFQRQAPFQWREPTIWQAFLSGSAGPDMGVFPGGVSLISDLAHYERSGELCSALVAEARTDVERAYAWGWVAHCIADQILHPLINRGAGALLKNDPSSEISYADHPSAHVRVELGLDAWWVVQAPRLKPIRTGRKDGVRFEDVPVIAKAYSNTYGGLDFQESLARSHRAVQRWAGAWVKLAQIHANRQGWQLHRSLRTGLAELALLPGRWATCFFSPQDGTRGLFRATAPPEWLIRDCRQLIGNFEEQYLLHLSAGAAALPNYNLDTGCIDDPAAPYSLAERTGRELQQLLNGEPLRGTPAQSG